MVTAFYPLNHLITLHGESHYEGPELHLQETPSSNLVLQIATSLGTSVKQVSLGAFCKDRQIDIEIFRKFINACDNCQIIDFSYCEDLDSEKIKSIGQIFKNKANLQIKELGMRSLPLLKERDLKELNDIPSLKKVTLQQNVHINGPITSNVLNFEVIQLPGEGYEDLT